MELYKIMDAVPIFSEILRFLRMPVSERLVRLDQIVHSRALHFYGFILAQQG
jgi:hypothetical protein